jgi:predicted nucleic acid-binding protein
LNEKNSGVLVDTSVWIEFFKQQSETGDKLSELIIKNVVWTCGIVLFEIIQGVKTEDEKATLLETLLILPYVEMTQPLWQRAGDLSASLKKKGVNFPLSDIFIAAICLEHNFQIFTLDKHFEQIRGVKIYKM